MKNPDLILELGPALTPVPRLALTQKEAAKALGVCTRTIWKLAASGQIHKTAYGVYPVASLEAHLKKEMAK